MNISEFGVIVETIRSAFEKEGFLSDVKDKKLWFETLKDMDYQTVAENLDRHIKTSVFVPKVAELRGALDTKDFNNFKRRRYNMGELEQQLLEASRQEYLEIEENQGGYINGN